MTWSRWLTAIAASLLIFAGGCTGTATPAHPEVYVGPPRSGIFDPLGAKWDWARVNAYGSYLSRLSGGTTWQEAVWCQIEPSPDVWRWEVMDNIMASSQRLGFQLDLKLRTGSCWVTHGRGGHARGQGGRRTASARPADPTAYAQFVARVVDRYGPRGVRRWAVENEPNAVTFWDGSASEYEQLVRQASQVIRAHQPGATVLDGGISSTGWGTAVGQHLLGAGDAGSAVTAWNTYFDRRQASRSSDFPPAHSPSDLRKALAGAQPARNLQFVDATRRLVRDGTVDALQVHFYERFDNVASLMAAARDVAGPSVPIEVWEAGRFYPNAPAQDPDAEAETVKTTTLLLAAGASRVIWLPLLPNSGGHQSSPARSGLVTSSGVPVPAGIAFASLVEITAGARTKPVNLEGVEGVEFDKPAGNALVVWGSGPGSVIPGAAPPGSRLTDMQGRPVAWPAAGLSLGAVPLLVRLPRGTHLLNG